MKTKTASDGPPVIRDVFPMLCVRDGAAALDFYKGVFGATETLRLAYPNGRIAHAELQLGPVTLMLSDEHPDYGVLSPDAYGGSGVRIHLHVDDVDRLARRALDAGASMMREPTDESHGERQCRIRDPFGHEWLLGHSLDEVSADDIRQRFEEEFGGRGTEP